MFTVKELKSYKKLVAVAITIIAIFGSSLFMYNYIIDSVKATKEEAIDQAKSERFDYIWSFLHGLLEQAENSSTEISSKIEEDILSSFDLDELRAGLNAGDPEFKSALHDIISSNIDSQYLNNIDNHRNAMLILSGDGTIIEDYTLDYSQYNDDSIFDSKSFLRYRDIAINKPLFDKAFNSVKSHSKGIIAIELYDFTNNPDHVLIPEITYSTLKQVYLQEGIDGFKNYRFLQPSYITDTGDIFGQQDIVAGEPQHNFKFIVIQSFNLYDQLTIMRSDEDTDYFEAIEERYDRIVDLMHLLGFFLCITIIVCILYNMSLFNVIADERDEEIALEKINIEAEEGINEEDIKNDDITD